MAGRTKTWKSVEIDFRKIPWVEKSLFLRQFFTLATMVILILVKSRLNYQKWRFLIRKKSDKKSEWGGRTKETPPYVCLCVLVGRTCSSASPHRWGLRHGALPKTAWSMINNQRSTINDQRSKMKMCQNWLQNNSLGWKITFPGSVFYAGNDGDTRFAQKLVKWSKMKVSDQKKIKNIKTT